MSTNGGTLIVKLNIYYFKYFKWNILLEDFARCTTVYRNIMSHGFINLQITNSSLSITFK